MNHKLFRIVCGIAALLLPASLPAAEQRVLHGHVPAVLPQLQTTGRLPATRRLDLSIGLGLRDRDGLHNLFEQIYDPASTNFHRFLTPEEFTERFAPTEQDFEIATNFARTNGLALIRAYPNRVVFDVSGAVSDIEKAFHLRLHSYRLKWTPKFGQ